MRTILVIFALVFGSIIYASPKAFFNYKVFYTPEYKPFVATVLQFSSGTFKYKTNEQGDLITKIEITQIFSQGDSIILVDKYILDSPAMKDSIVEDFYDAQKYGLEPGVYGYELIIKDLISNKEIAGGQSIKVDPCPQEEFWFSDIELIQNANKTEENNAFTKNGFFMLPYLTNYYPPQMDKIAFYFEVYNAAKILGEDKSYLLTYSVSDFVTGEPVDEVFRFQRMKAKNVSPVIGYLPIEDLPSGEYNLEIRIINMDNDTVFSKDTYFHRRNTIEQELVAFEDAVIDKSFETIDTDSLPYFLGCLMPISERHEYETIRKMMKTDDTLLMQKYFYTYWKTTDPIDPYAAWMKYRSQIKYAEKMFGTQIKHCYETDRGRIYLRYGAPNQVIDRPNEPSAYPYQIWHYYRVGQRSNIRFVFYNPDLVTNDYPLLHSNLPGEIQNYRWEHDLHKRNSPFTDIDNPSDGNIIHYGGNSSIYYQNP